MQITIVYDNTVYTQGLKSDWGFSCVVEAEHSPKILFDTGANGMILLSNMRNLGIDPVSIETVIISHSHFDHTGGLSSFLNANSEVDVYVPHSFRGLRGARNVIHVSEPLEIHKNIFSTGELSGIEQSIAIQSGKGLVVIDGCSHPGVGRILEAAEKHGTIHSLIGGLHGFNDFELLEKVDFVCPTHCTQYIQEIKKLYPEKYIEGGVGRIIEI
jgi:7,8-dihydropterin-6-yl-methyl-4-(beta-D-ribofuranosyl)aminobenzene 5'-phosphate synthase